MSVKYFLRIIGKLQIVAILFSIGCADTSQNVRGVWKTVREGDWSARLNDVHFISETHGWAVGNPAKFVIGHGQRTSPTYTEGGESIILHTANGGQKWNKQDSGIFGKPLRKVYFRSKTEGWCIGDSGTLLRTTDGGQTWKQLKTDTENNLYDITMNSSGGWIVGDWATLLRTTDGGQTFEKVDGSAFEEKSLRGVYFVDDTHGWIITYSTPHGEGDIGHIYRTTDGGKTWGQQLATKPSLFSLHFIDRLTGWVVGDRRSLYATTDGGKTWEFLTHGSEQRHKSEYGQPTYLGKEPLHTFTLYDLDFVDKQHGWIAGDLGVILYTNSSGKQWKHQRGGPRFHNSADPVLLGIDFISKDLGWAVGEDGTILHTRNGGLTWESQSNPTYLLFDVYAVSENRGYIVGDRGAILQTDDGGTTWQAQDSRTPECFGGTFFVSQQKGWAVAEAGVILHTTNGGIVWEQQPTDTKQDLLAVFFIDAETGWCAGSAGEILHTTDGGKRWISQQSGVPHNLFDIHFTSKREGWATGIFGTLLHTVDGGKRWQLSKLSQHLAKSDRGNNIWLKAVHFVSPEIGWVVGEDGLIFHTNDGGKSWSRQNSYTQNFLYELFFINETEGWVVGKNGLVLHTEDGGKNWRPQRTYTQTDLTAIHMSTPRNGWAVGQGGTILKYEVVRVKTTTK